MRTFATLADTLVAGYDVVDLLQTLVDACRDLLDASAAGILLANDAGYLEVIASTSEASHLVEMMQLGAEAGPCIESFRTGQSVSVPDVADAPAAWVRFRDSALEQGFRSVYALPLRLRETTIGTLNLFRDTVGVMDESDEIAARAFADVATIGILHERSLRESNLVQEQLQLALGSRTIIEQAKGIVAFTKDISVDQAFGLIREHARVQQAGLGAVAARIVDRSLAL
ncbi:MAG: transcriptional regulator [Microbacteriaceae bacterium]|nr:transcriptional regulator [Microbacteriaceae bacterium]